MLENINPKSNIDTGIKDNGNTVMNYDITTLDTTGSKLEFCGNIELPGLALDHTPYVDYSHRDTTSDQTRIEQQLELYDLKGKSILHIGIGNSSLALRFSQKAAYIAGVSVSTAERKHARSQGLDNYHIFSSNKYGRDFITNFKHRQFDFIVDNNPAAFACCKYHLYAMFDNYLWCLKPGGKIMTDQRGLDWALLDPSFIFDFTSLTNLVANLPLKVKRLTPMVYALESRVPVNPDQMNDTCKVKLNVHALRRKKGKSYIETFEA